MQLVVGITALVVVCLGVPTAAQKPCSLQLSNSVLRLGACFFGVSKLQQGQQLLQIPDIRIGYSFSIRNIRVSKLKVPFFGCSVQSKAIPPPPTQPPVTVASPPLLPDNLGSGDGNEEQPTTIPTPTVPAVRNYRHYKVVYRGIQTGATGIWRRRRSSRSYVEGSVECTATATVTVEADAGIDRVNCPVIDNAVCKATVGPISMNIGNSRKLGSYYGRQLRNELSKRINEEVKKYCKSAAEFLENAEDNSEVMQLFRG